jgi:hypothetical protein
MRFTAFRDLHNRTEYDLHSFGKRCARVTAITQDALNEAKTHSVQFKHLDCTSAIRDICRSYVHRLRKPVRVNRYTALYTGYFFARVIPFASGHVGVSNALRVHYAVAGPLFPVVAGARRTDSFF